MQKMFRRMVSTNVGIQVDRTYHASGQFQWARETAVNAIEAGATRIEYSVEWQAVANKGVYRRTIADNGKGMTDVELEKFFNEYGGGGKTIGPQLDNFGVGAKTSLLPWNRHGVVVISWVDSQPSMIWIEHDPETSDYGLKLYLAEKEDGESVRTAVVEPYDDPEHGVDWSKIKPDWISDHGTMIILLGNDPGTDTINGDPNREESGLRKLAGYLNSRFWRLNGGHSAIHAHEFTAIDKNAWPKGRPEKLTYQTGCISRQVQGMEHWITNPSIKRETTASLESGSVNLNDGVIVDWHLWHGRPEQWSYQGAVKGCIAVLHRGELYNMTSDLASYRTFRISEKIVRDQLWLIICAPDHDPTKGIGVFPTIDRNQLRWGTGERLPFNEWGEEFSAHLPEQIFRALQACRRDMTHSITDPEWEKRLLQKFASRRALLRYRHDQTADEQSGPETTHAQQRHQGETQEIPRPASVSKQAPRPKVRPRLPPNIAPIGTINPARPSKATGALPKCEITHDAEAIEPGMLAAYSPPAPDAPGGLITLYGSHPILQREVAYWQQLYGDHQEDPVRDEVLQVYCEVAIAKVAHAEEMRAFIDSKMIDDAEYGMRSPQALTGALLGLLSEEKLIELRLARKVGKAKKKAA